MITIMFLLLSTERGIHSDMKKKAQKPSAKAQGDVCSICFGTIKNDEMIAKCACTQIFHENCAGSVGKCPYCELAYDKFTIEQPECVTCPSCGSGVVGNVCGCGAVVNRDGFTCGCGNELDVNDPVCRKCGKKYEVRSGRRV